MTGTGYWEPLVMEETKLVYVETTTGARVEQEIFSGGLGLEPMVTPWTSIPATLEPGRYDVTFVAESVRPSWYGYEQKTH